MPHKDRDKYLQYHRDYWKSNPEKVRDRKLRHDFGISLEDYLALHAKQHGVCAVCFKPETAIHNKTKKVQNLAVDHNHKTDQVRGLLCSRCNTALGLLDEDVQRLLSLIKYVESSNGEVD